MEKFYTYFHTRNDTGAVFYVGKGFGSRAHVSTKRNRYWHNVVDKAGHTVHFAMTGLAESESFEHEKFLIKCFRDMGVKLTNLTDGGEGPSGAVVGPETRAKLGVASRRTMRSPEQIAAKRQMMNERWADPAYRQKLLNVNTGRKNTPEIIEKMRLAKAGYTPTVESIAKVRATMATPESKAKRRALYVGKFVSEETRKRIGNAKRGIPMPEKTRAALKVANTGRKMSDTTKAALSAANKDRCVSPETMARMSVSAKNKTVSPETRARLSAASLSLWAKRRQLTT